ncbi:proteasome assembly chaperone family protein [Candidatus Woesearchaeota archaeon]|nr:proteasome assembly chaperone family protein [Candidatus Woesearchaeota archaeon]
MTLRLTKKLKNPVIIQGFPGFGLVGTITTEFLVDHLKTESIGSMYFEKMPAIVAIHDQQVVQPIGIHYSKEHNLVILHAITASTGQEWNIVDTILTLARDTGASEIISVEGVGSQETVEKPQSFGYSSSPVYMKKLQNIGLKPLKEGIIMGVTSALLVKASIPVTCIFAETHSQLPDSKAAAKVVEALDKYLSLKVDTKPLLKTAEKFEQKIKSLLEQGQLAQKQRDLKQMSYIQ